MTTHRPSNSQSTRTQSQSASQRRLLHLWVDELEEAWNDSGDQPPDFTDHLPSEKDVVAVGLSFDEVATELLRVDFERRWQFDPSTRIEFYRTLVPELWQRKSIRSQLAFEQYRNIESNTADTVEEELPFDNDDRRSDYARRYAIDTSSWSSCSSGVTHHSERSTPLPRPGERFEGFEIIERLSRCRDGAVYLAEQPALANRQVVIKMTSERWHESDRLAKLRHTYVMPIHSVHYVDRWQVVCMPYLGRATLHHVLDALRRQFDSFEKLTQHDLASTIEQQNESRQDSSVVLDRSAGAGTAGESYERSVLQIFLKLAQGLQHAHERGLLHRDLKPANILMAECDTPLLFDFDLSQEVAQPQDAVGGTLRYMSPEQRIEFSGGDATVDERSDLYSLGFAMFETLTGELPFPDLDASLLTSYTVARDMRSDTQLAKSMVNLERCVSPSTASIVRRCLACSPGDRYASTSELIEDLDRQLEHQPLRHAPNPSYRELAEKFLRRHPRLRSVSAVMTVSTLMIAVAMGLALARGRQLERHEAQAAWQQYEQRRDEARSLVVPWVEAASIDRGLNAAFDALNVFGFQGQRATEQQRHLERLPQELRDTYATQKDELAWLIAASIQRRAALFPDAKFPATLEARIRAFEKQPTDRPNDLFEHPFAQVANQDYAKALDPLERRCKENPSDFAAQFLRGMCHHALGQNFDAIEAFTCAATLWPESHLPLYMRALVYWEFDRDFAPSALQHAERDFTLALDRRPDAASIYHNRALVRRDRGNWDGVIEDVTAAIDRFGERPAWLALRAEAFQQIQSPQSAARDRQQITHIDAITEEDWCIKSDALLTISPEQALAAVESGLERFPGSMRLIRNKIVLLAEHLGDLEAALSTIDASLEGEANSIDLRLIRAELLVRLGRGREALEALDRIQRDDQTARTLYHIARLIISLGPDNLVLRQEAAPLLTEAIRLDPRLREAAEKEPHLATLIHASP